MLQIIVSAFISLGMIAGAFNYTEQHSQVKLGANSTISALTALTSPAYDDVIAIVDSSPTPTTKKMTWAVATSSIQAYLDGVYAPKIGSTNITTLGTITTGIWNGTPISVGYGGSGTTTWASNYVLLGNGASGVKTVSGQGLSGYLLTSNGPGLAPTWQNVAVALNTDNTWTGLNMFNATTTLVSTTINGKNAEPKFGGNGSDGALTITSGTTTIDLANAAYVVKNYTHIMINSGASLGFSNPNANGTIIILKSTGSSTIAGNIYAAGMGAATDSNGTGQVHLSALTNGGAAFTYSNNIYSKTIDAVPGSGGATGGGTGAGAGGRGGGAVILEIAGTYNFPSTGKIIASGLIGGTGTGNGTNTTGGGGGGGSGGSISVVYETLIANAGAYTVIGGNGGTGGTCSGGESGGGAGGTGGKGGSHAFVGGNGGTGGSGGAGGSSGSAGGGTGGSGGAGGAACTLWGGGGGGGGGSTGFSVVAQNTEF